MTMPQDHNQVAATATVHVFLVYESLSENDAHSFELLMLTPLN